MTRKQRIARTALWQSHFELLLAAERVAMTDGSDILHQDGAVVRREDVDHWWEMVEQRVAEEWGMA